MHHFLLHPKRVQNLATFLSLSVISIFLSSCGSGGFLSGNLYDPGYGPFDANGNYLENEADKPAKQNRSPRNIGYSTGKETENTPVQTAKVVNITPVRQETQPVPSPPKVYTAPPKPVVKKTAPKPVIKSQPKPAFTYHTVKKGDTLYNISRRYKTSVGALQRANAISGSTILMGQRIKIPN